MKRTVLFVCAALTVFSAFSQEKKSTKKPNIVLLFADDISSRELPIYGSTVWSKPTLGGRGKKPKGYHDTSDPKYRAFTPNLDKIANEGCFIETTFAATVCRPSRAMMMTGRYAHLHKWWHNKDRGKSPDGDWKWDLYDSSPHTIAHVAKKGGYATYWSGKTQMSIEGFPFDEGCFTNAPRKRNEKELFTDFKLSPKKIDGKKVLINEDTQKPLNFWCYAQTSWYWQPSVKLMTTKKDGAKKLEVWPNTKETKTNYGLTTYGPDVELDYIFDFMERKTKEDEPFFVYHTSHLGHDAFDYFYPESKNKWPGTPKIKWDGKKYTRTEPKITGDSGVYNTHNTVTEQGIHHHVNYLDYQVWLYIKKFKELGIENNTIFIFCADNATSGYGKSSPVSQRGTHVPLIIYAPGMGMTKKGRQNVLANISDILPTIADISGVEIPEDYEINGESLIPFLTTDKQIHREWIYGYHMNKTIIRGSLVLKGGNNKWYDVSKTPDDLISFPVIKDWTKVSEAHRQEMDKLKKILPKYDLHATKHDAPKDGYGKVTPLKIK